MSLIRQRTNRSKYFKNSTRSHYRFLGADQLTEHVEKETGGQERAYRRQGEVLCKSQSLQLARCAANGCIRRSTRAPLGRLAPSVIFVPSMLQLHVHGGLLAPFRERHPSLSLSLLLSSPFLVEWQHQGFSFYTKPVLRVGEENERERKG